MENSVADILKSWCLDHLVPVFEEQGIDLDAFNWMTEEAIKDLIPRVGDRLKFNNYFRIYKASNQPVLFDISNKSDVIKNPEASETESIRAVTPSTSSSSSSVYDDFLQDKPLEIIPVPAKPQHACCAANVDDILNDPEPLTYDFNLEEFLQGSVDGRAILRSKGQFTPAIRNNLTNILIKNEFNNDDRKSIPTSRFIQLARLIKKLFPTENIATYFTPYQTDAGGHIRRCARGKLYDKYHNLRRNLRTTGILKSKKRNIESQNEMSDGNEIVQEQDELIQWLQFCTEPWTDVIEKWELTFESRQRILKTDIDAQAYFDKFLALKQPLGFTLIELDFKKIYQEYENKLFYHMPELLELIIDNAKQSRNPTVRKFLEENATCENDDQRLALGLLVLPYLFSKTQIIAPKQRQKKDNEDNLKKNKRIQWRPSRTEVQESFIVHLKSATELQPFLERRSRVDLTQFEPIISFNDLKFQVGNLMKTVDVLFKLFHVVNLKYPVECDHVWMLIQKYVYGISTSYDTPHVVVEQLYSDLLQKKVE